MKKAIIVHGILRSKEYVAQSPMSITSWYWMPWLQQQYYLNDVNCQVPLLPHSWFPDKKYEDDAEVFSQFKISGDMRLIGFSAGTTFLFRYLSEHPEIKAKHLVLIAPHLNPDGLLDFYFDFDRDFDRGIFDRFEQIDMLWSADDPYVGVAMSAEKLMQICPRIKAHKFEDYRHFSAKFKDDREFAELWEICRTQV